MGIFPAKCHCFREIFGKQEEAKTQLEELSSAIDQTKRKQKLLTKSTSHTCE